MPSPLARLPVGCVRGAVRFARILILLPIFMFCYIYIFNYEYISLMWTERLGIFMLAGGIAMQVIGSLFIRSIVRIEM